ncbi:MAG: CinA family protein [Bacteroidia bacterium]|nr:CinA family protein [Bacteroidia bacterium]
MNIFDIKTINEISRLLQAGKQTVAVAESCTAGLIANALSQADDATLILQGGITAYNLGQKAKHLNVNPVVAENCNSVSKEVAEKMALEIASAFNAEIGVGITGYALPVPDAGIKSCYAFIAVAENSKIILSGKIMGDTAKDLFGNQRIFTDKTLNELLKVLKKK